jgi:hypothetical protein
MTFDQDGGYLTTPRQKDLPPCEETMQAGDGKLLGCNLKLSFHKVHHDPRGYWWAKCTLPGHGHEEGDGSAAVQ